MRSHFWSWWITGCAADDAADEAAPSVASSTSTSAAPAAAVTTVAAATSSLLPPVQPEGFDLAPVEVTLADGEVCALCLWVAATPVQRQQGLMGVTDLGPADGMVFVYDGPASGAFWMCGTPMPLSIAFFADDGSFVSAADMEPCLSGPAEDCLRYSAAAPT